MSPERPSGEERPSEPEPMELEDLDLDEDLEEFLEAWDAADRDAAAVLRGALGHLRGQDPPSEALAAIAGRVRDGLSQGDHPFDWIRRAAGLAGKQFPDSDVELLLRCAAATISPREETGLELDEEAMLISLENADWLGAIVSVARDGAGGDASPEALVDGIGTCPEVVIESEVDFEEEEAHLEAAFWIVALPWQVLGLTDRDQRLTEVGAWILPRALARTWGSDFDGGGAAD